MFLYLSWQNAVLAMPRSWVQFPGNASADKNESPEWKLFALDKSVCQIHNLNKCTLY